MTEMFAFGSFATNARSMFFRPCLNPVMQFAVFSPCQQFKIGRSIVEAISIYMMHNFSRSQWSTYDVRNDNPMLVFPNIGFTSFYLPVKDTVMATFNLASDWKIIVRFMCLVIFFMVLAIGSRVSEFSIAFLALSWVIVSLSIRTHFRGYWVPANSAWLTYQFLHIESIFLTGKKNKCLV